MIFGDLKDKQELTNYLATFGSEFLLSADWAQLLKIEGANYQQVGVRDENRKLLAVATVVKKSLKSLNKSYLYLPRGPIGEPLAIKFLLESLSKAEPRAIFIRLEPREKLALPNLRKTINLQPAQTLVIDLAQSEQELLAAMHQKTRYNIRLAEKKGVEIIESDDIQDFWRLLNLTGDRDGFRLHSLKHYQNLLSGDKKFIKLFFARYQGRNIAAGIFCFFGDKVTYLHGASDNKFRSIMAPYLLQWSLIKMAQEKGYKHYDFYGIDEYKWPGVTRFKLGFSGQVVTYPGTFDLVIKPALYCLYNFLRRLRRLI